MNQAAVTSAIWAALVACLFSTSVHAQSGAAARIEAAESRAVALEAQNAQLRDTVETQAAAIRRLDQQVEDLRTQLVEANQAASQQADTAAERARALEEALQSAQRREDELRAQIAADDSAERLARAQDQIRQLEAALIEAEEHQATIAARLAEAQQREAALRERLDSDRSEEQLATARAELEQAAARHAEQLAAAQADVERTRAQLKHVLDRHQALQARMSSAVDRDTHDTLQARHTATLEVMEQLKAEHGQALAQCEQQLAARPTPNCPQAAPAPGRCDEAAFQQRLRDELRSERAINAATEAQLEKEVLRLQSEVSRCRVGG